MNHHLKPTCAAFSMGLAFLAWLKKWSEFRRSRLWWRLLVAGVGGRWLLPGLLTLPGWLHLYGGISEYSDSESTRTLPLVMCKYAGWKQYMSQAKPNTKTVRERCIRFQQCQFSLRAGVSSKSRTGLSSNKDAAKPKFLLTCTKNSCKEEQHSIAFSLIRTNEASPWCEA